mmetsp:Transcript_5476/g.10863  ORF Transcript_5476/g.10863 Transcript_5476/m.10863 type:complete len:333 (-) Transcript_5476:231-1229(-)
MAVPRCVCAFVLLPLLILSAEQDPQQCDAEGGDSGECAIPGTETTAGGDLNEVARLSSEVESLREAMNQMNATLQRICQTTCACGGKCNTAENGPDKEGWMDPTLPDLYRVEEPSWTARLFRLGFLQHFSVIADTNPIGKFEEEGPIWKLWQDTVSFYDEHGKYVGILVESPVKWFLGFIPNLIGGRKYWYIYDRDGVLKLYGSPEPWINSWLRGDAQADMFWLPEGGIRYTSKMTNVALKGNRKWHITRNDNLKCAEIEEINTVDSRGRKKTGWLIEVEYSDRIDPLFPGFLAAYNKFEDTTTLMDWCAFIFKLTLNIALVWGAIEGYSRL